MHACHKAQSGAQRRPPHNQCIQKDCAERTNSSSCLDTKHSLSGQALVTDELGENGAVPVVSDGFGQQFPYVPITTDTAGVVGIGKMKDLEPGR